MNDLNPLAPMAEAIEKRRRRAAIAAENRQMAGDALRMVLVLGIAAVLFLEFFSFRIISGNGMYPALSDGDLVLTYRKTDLVKDDVVFYTVGGSEYVGRVVAKAGDYLTVNPDGMILVNGTPQTTEVAFPTYTDEEWYGTTLIPEGTVFILGDYRTQTKDSRDFGFIPLADIRMKAFAVLRHIGI